MSPATQIALQRFRQYPPLLRWFLVGAVVVILFIIWSFLVWDTSQAWNARAEEYRAAITNSRADAERLSIATQRAILALGETEPIGNNVEGEQALSALIIEVLERHHATKRDVQRKQSVGFRGQVPPVFPGGQGERVLTEVGFEATPESAFAVVLELESSPLVETVSKVQIAKGNDPRLKSVAVKLTVEAWVSPGAPPTRPLQPRGPVPATENTGDDDSGGGDDVAADTRDEGSAIP